MKTVSRSSYIALVLVLAFAACVKKKSSSSSGGGVEITPPPASTVPTDSQFVGAWQFFHNSTTGDGSCVQMQDHKVGDTVVDANGNFSMNSEGEYHGVVDPGGTVTFTVSGLGACGPINGSGTCSSASACSGTFNTSTYSGVWRMTR